MAPRRNSNISGNPSQQQHPQQQPQLQLSLAQQQQSQLLHFFTESSNPPSSSSMAPMQLMQGSNVQLVRCCYPSGECRKLDALIALTETSLADCVRVLCNNENCGAGQYMHRECFEVWEAGVLQTLKASGRARSWSERQRAQHLWTKKGYDLVYKACSCKCGRGQLRKDLEWSVPASNGGLVFLNGNGSGGGRGSMNGNLSEDDDKKKAKKKRNRNGNSGNSGSGGGNQKNGVGVALTPLSTNNSNGYGGGSNGLTPNPNVGVIGSGLPHNTSSSNGNGNGNSGCSEGNGLQPSVVATLSNILNPNNVLGLDLRARAGSLSSSGAGSGSSSPSASQSSADISLSPVQQLLQQQQQQASLLMQPLVAPPTAGYGAGNNALLLQNGLGLAKNLLAPQQSHTPALPALANISNFKPLVSYEQQQLVQQQKNKEVELYSERVRSTSGCNGIFSRRLDFSAFNKLPNTRLNSYQVKIEDEGNHGNDETRLFILSSLATSHMSRVSCILCEEPLLVFDRYPLVDGSFFLSPKQHSSGCIEVKYEGRTLYLTSVCMSCLDGTSSSRLISCRFCKEPWDGSSLVLGTMYAYDIFAAMPCCAERFKCNNCFKMLMHPQQRLSFYSDYSHGVTCPYCNTQDTHFVKPLSFCYAKSSATRLPTLA
ncbi:headcase protein [Drosophila miranda]|uniref:headcase protein n=1 Tax=Drosophila miranda TaxID=7229 RepID=UPI00143F9DED|nr:headcase protein [Drosophila miranda]